MLEESSSFVICDAKVTGYPIRYASKGYRELFGSDFARCEGGRAGAAGLLGNVEHVAAVNELAARSGLSQAEAFTSLKLMEDAIESSVSSSVSSQASAPVLLLKWSTPQGCLLVCEMSVCQRQHPALGWPYYAVAMRDVTERVPAMKLLQEASKGSMPYSDFCRAFGLQQAFSHAGSLSDSLAASGKQLNSAAEQMWQQELTSWGDSLKLQIDEKPRADGDVRSMASRSTACTLKSCASSSEAPDVSAGMHHLGGLVALTAEATPQCTGADQRFMDLLEVEVERGWEERETLKGSDLCSKRPETDEKQNESSKAASSKFKSCNSETTCESFSDTGVEALQPLSRSLIEAVKLISRPCLKNLALPVLIATPDQNQLAVVLCSQGFERFSGYRSAEAVGQDLQAFLACPPENLVNWNLYYDAVLSGSFFQPLRPMDSGIIALGDRSCAGLPAGELAFAEVFTSRSGSLTRGLVHLKQVQLDDEHFVIALLAAAADSESYETSGQLTAAFQKLNCQVDQLISTLASEFFFQAPCRRQVSCSQAGLAFNEWS